MNGNDQFGSPCFSDLECDAVLLLRNSSYGLIEIKLSSDFFEGIWMPDTEIWYKNDAIIKVDTDR